MLEQDAPSGSEWEAALERLEVRLNRAQRMGTTVEAGDLDLGLPASLHTIPRYLLPRAQSLIERQQQMLLLVTDRAAPRGPGQRGTRGGTLHDRVAHLITGPREPLGFDFFEGAVGDRRAPEAPTGTD